jgi:hypothetical protein
MSTYDATVMRVEDDHGVRAVVTQAEDIIHVADELLAHASDPNRERIAGDIELDGDLISFGTPGEGLGRLTYRRIGVNAPDGWTIYKRETAA